MTWNNRYFHYYNKFIWQKIVDITRYRVGGRSLLLPNIIAAPARGLHKIQKSEYQEILSRGFIKQSVMEKCKIFK